MASVNRNTFPHTQILVQIAKIKITIVSLIIVALSLYCIPEPLAVFVHKDIINKNDYIGFPVVPRKQAVIVNVTKKGFPHVNYVINNTYPCEWGKGKYIEYGEEIKEVNFSKLVEEKRHSDQNVTITVMNDVFVSMLQVIYSEKHYYYFDKFCQTIFIDKYFNPGFLPYRVIGSYENVVCIGHYNIRVYGHYIIDFLAPLMLIPKEILDKCVIPFAFRALRTSRMFPSPFSLKGLHLIGLRKSQLVVMYPQDLIFAKNAYYLNDFPFNYGSSEAFRRLQKAILETHPPKAPPFRFGMYNRRKDQHRYINNFKEIVAEASKRWPEYHPEVTPDFSVFLDAINYYQELQIFWMGFHGSVLGNLIFMQTGSVVIEVQTRRPFTNSISITLPLGIHHVMSRYTKVGHYEFAVVIFDMEDTMKTIEIAVGLLNHSQK